MHSTPTAPGKIQLPRRRGTTAPDLTVMLHTTDASILPEVFHRWSLTEMDVFLDGPASQERKAAVLASTWMQTHTPLVHRARDKWVAAFRSIGFINGFSLRPDLLPAEPLTVWRAATPEYVRGLSWTTSRVVANARLQKVSHGPGFVYECVVQPEWVLARMPQGPLQEYIVDIPRECGGEVRMVEAGRNRP